MYRVLSIERTRPQPSGSDGAGGGGQRPAPQPAEAAGARSFPFESSRDSGRMGYRGEPAQGRGAGAFRQLDARIAAALPVGPAAGCDGARHRIGGTTRNGGAGTPNFVKTLALAAIGFYRAAISPALPSSCRFYPSCSVYAHEAVSVWGLRRGLGLTLRRLGRCRPFGPYGYDPVPERANSTTEATEDTEKTAAVSVSSVPSVVKCPRAGENSEALF